MKFAIILGFFVLTLPTTGFAQASEDDYFLGLLDGKPPRDLEQKLAKAAQFPLGSADNPVRVDDPAGERGYLKRLRCQDGNAPSFKRVGSSGLGPFDHIIDDYLVTCKSSTPAESHIYMDMYFPDYVEREAPIGFNIVPPVSQPNPPST